jgi:hypothetical protein
MIAKDDCPPGDVPCRGAIYRASTEYLLINPYPAEEYVQLQEIAHFHLNALTWS